MADTTAFPGKIPIDLFSPDVRLIGVDECGRGCGSGPVIAAAVCFRAADLPDDLLAALDDSKRLSASKREELAALIPNHAVVGIGAGSARLIDEINIRQATLRAMARAVERLEKLPGVPVPLVLVDGKDVPQIPLPARPLVGGDGLVKQISAASVIAKVFRDRLMQRLSRRYEPYGWDRNSGYLTKEHRQAVAAHGLTGHHRRSFRIPPA
jgi:ribonuclease HII